MTADLEAMARAQAAGISIDAGLTAQVGRLAAALEREHRTRQQRAQAIRYAPIQPVMLVPSTAGVAGVTTFASAELWGPKTGYFWAIQRMTAGGLAGPGSTLTAQGTATSPATFQTLLTLSGLTPYATYSVSVTAQTSGTTAAPAEVNNFRLAATGETSLIIPSAPGGTVTSNFDFTTGSSGNILITTGSNTPTTGAVYTASVSAQSAADTLNIYRGQPAVNNFLANLELSAPEWRPGRTGLILQPGDFITAQGTGLVGSPVALNFDAIIGTLDLLPEYLI